MPDCVELSPGIGIPGLRIEWVERMARSRRIGRRVKFGIPNGGGGCCAGIVILKDQSISLAMSSNWEVWEEVGMGKNMFVISFDYIPFINHYYYCYSPGPSRTTIPAFPPTTKRSLSGHSRCAVS